ncbi:MAG TPA: carbamoyl-phosphate synthase large subunit [Clostridia bacterium]|nr:carbamoyl-phosphate synthase large subunit [Clostridia bacterium]
MSKKRDINSVLVIGSGPVIIGQAAEFDYAGTQACRALKEEGVRVILVNSNPATIMTDMNMADRVYIEPLTVEIIENIIKKERPDSILPTLGGQTGLNLAVSLAEKGFLDKYNVKLLGTSVDSIKKAEDRELFKKTMDEIGQPVIESMVACNHEEALEFANQIGYPVVVRPAYTLGGTGGGIANNDAELLEIAADGLRLSRVNQVLIEKSVEGWKEIEYEVVRDGKGNCITVCNMENLDPVGIHTGDSIVVAPSLTLRDKECQMLRTASINIINALKIEGGCNIQFALDPKSMKYYVIEVNPRVSRSSALASKATGYPIAKVSTKIALGYGLDEIQNSVTGKTYACFEPSLDYVVVKIPRWPFDKFVKADVTLGTRMKATGEVMAIGSTFEMALMKAIYSLELGFDSLELPYLSDLSDREIAKKLGQKTYERLFIVGEALRRGISVSEISRTTGIDAFFLHKISNIVKQEEELKKISNRELDKLTLKRCKNMGFSDSAIARFVKADVKDIQRKRKEYGILPVYKVVDTCAAEFEAVSPYYYSSYGDENEVDPGTKPKVVIIGSGPIRIGQGIEFDYCSVHSIWALKKLGYQAVIINNNPETVSTDFDISDRLYFEPLVPEFVLNVLDKEKPDGVMVQFGGQSAIGLVKSIHEAGYRILGTPPEYINKAEDRKEFDVLLEQLGIPRPEGGTAFGIEEAVDVAEKLGYPVLVRPSYVLGGQGMEIAYTDKDVAEFMSIINRTKYEHPVLIDKYIRGREIEVDAVCDGQDILIPGIMEHIERAGIHSGDSISVYPPRNISGAIIQKIVDYTAKLAIALKIRGLINIQFIEHNGKLYVIEVNPRSSRTVPFISKVTGTPMVELATRAMLGQKLKDLGYGTGLRPSGNIVAVKVPVFSLDKLPMTEVGLGPEMKSTGEVLGMADNLHGALYKGLAAAGYSFSGKGTVLMSVADIYQHEAVNVAKELKELGFNILATEGTAKVLNMNGIKVEPVNKLGQSDGNNRNIDDVIKNRSTDLIINIPTRGRIPERAGFKIRRMAVENSIPCITSLDTAQAFLDAIRMSLKGNKPGEVCLNDI